MAHNKCDKCSKDAKYRLTLVMEIGKWEKASEQDKKLIKEKTGKDIEQEDILYIDDKISGSPITDLCQDCYSAVKGKIKYALDNLSNEVDGILK